MGSSRKRRLEARAKRDEVSRFMQIYYAYKHLPSITIGARADHYLVTSASGKYWWFSDLKKLESFLREYKGMVE